MRNPAARATAVMNSAAPARSARPRHGRDSSARLPQALDRTTRAIVDDLAAIYLSTAPPSVALPPFGTLGIEPALAVPFSTLVIPQPSGVGRAGFTIPNVPGLIGQIIYSQTMPTAYPSDLRLSNVVRDVIAP